MFILAGWGIVPSKPLKSTTGKKEIGASVYQQEQTAQRDYYIKSQMKLQPQ